MTIMQTIPNAIRTVMSQPQYLGVSIVIALASAGLLVLSTSIPGQSLQSWLFSTTATTKFLVFFSAVMLGLIASVQLYAWRTFRTIKKEPTTLSAGALVGTLTATACCSPLILPIVGIAGFGSAFLVLQQHQLAVVLISVALLFGALHYSCKIVDCQECRTAYPLKPKDRTSQPLIFKQIEDRRIHEFKK